MFEDNPSHRKKSSSGRTSHHPKRLNWRTLYMADEQTDRQTGQYFTLTGRVHIMSVQFWFGTSIENIIVVSVYNSSGTGLLSGDVDDDITQVLLGHGTRVIIRGERWFDLYIYASPSDWQHTQGNMSSESSQNNLRRLGRAASPSLTQKMDSPAACAISCTVPTADESNHSATSTLHLHILHIR